MPTPSRNLIRQIPSLSGRLAHYYVPEGYFDGLSTRILSQILLDKPVTGDRHDDTPNARRRPRFWVRLCLWVVTAIALIVVIALWSAWRGDAQEFLRSDNEVVSPVYDPGVTPPAGAEYADHPYETCVDIPLDDYTIGETMGVLSEDEI